MRYYSLLATLLAIALLANTIHAAGLTDKVICRPDENAAFGATVEASSAASPAGGKYAVEMLADNDATTAWASANSALPQWVKVSFPEPRQVDTLVLMERDLPNLYAHWKTVQVEFSEGAPVTAQLEDTGGPHIIRFPARTAAWLQVTVTEVWETKTYVGLEELMAFSDPEQKIKLKVSPKKVWSNVDLTETGREYHPCVYMTPDDVARARRNIEQYEWAKAFATQTIKLAEDVVDKDPQWIRDNCPKAGAAFAYGFTGCPICSAQWGTWGGANCSFDRPGTVKCSNGHILPDADHPDPGTGYEGPDGRIHYFVGSYNAWVVETYQTWCGRLSEAYLLTGDERYARTCGILLDTLSEVYPDCTAGSWDYPSTPPSGRFCRPWYQVARVLVKLVEYYDAIHNSPSLDEPSWVEGSTRRQSIENRMLKDGAWYCYNESLKGGLHNGEADYIRGALAVGCLLGIESYVDWALDGPYGIRAMINNNADRNGRYFESSLSYALHARDLYLTFAEPLFNYRSPDYPNGVNLYDDAGFRMFYVIPRLSMDLAGHWPRYGDSGPDTAWSAPPKALFDSTDYIYAERIFNRATDPAVKEQFGKLVNYFGAGDLDKVRAGSSDKQWLVYNAGDPPTAPAELDPELRRMAAETYLMGQKGMVLLRTPNSPLAQACLLRYGPVLNHGHFDDLNINYIAQGFEVTYDLGYGLGSTHTQVGWAKQTPAHQLVVVDERRQNSGAGDDTGGDLHLCVGMPGMQIADAAADDCYQSLGVDTYRRFLALVGNGADSYLLDVFTVEGGKQHDYCTHALSDQMSLEGIALGEPAAGSLAGPEFDWGARQLNDGDMQGVPKKPYWNPPPENGLGFLMQPRRADANGPFSATWKLPQGERYLRTTYLPEEGTEVIGAWAPGIYPRLPKAEHVILRRTGDDLNSTFVSVREPYGDKPVDIGGQSGSELMPIVRSEDGVIKYIAGYDIVLFQANAFGGEVHFDLQARVDGEHYLVIAPYMSPNYGQADFFLDGQPVGERFVANDPSVQPGPLQIIGPMNVAAGPHTLTIKTVEHPGGSPWVSIKQIALTQNAPRTEGGEVTPLIKSVERRTLDGGATAVTVSHVDGLVDRIIYACHAGSTTAGNVELDGCFGCIRTDADQITNAWLIGESLKGPGFSIELGRAGHRGRIERVDYERNLVYVTGTLPDDGRLRNQTIVFDNDDYSRNTAYTIYDVRREDGRTVIDLGPQRTTLGQGTINEPPLDDHTLYSLAAHEYGRALGRGATRFFVGKALQNADGSVDTTIRGTTFAQPFGIDVESTRGIQAGMDVYYRDIKPGDEFEIRNFAAATIDLQGKLHVTATDDVKVQVGNLQQEVKWTGQ